jgi:hypothetical protein
MFCEIADMYGFVGLWLAMSVLGLVSVILLSSALFVPYYVNVT